MLVINKFTRLLLLNLQELISKKCFILDRHPVHDLLVGTWNLGTGYGPVYSQNVDVLKIADETLFADLAGETVVPFLDIQDLSSLKAVR